MVLGGSNLRLAWVYDCWCLVVVVLGGRCDGVAMLVMVLPWDGERENIYLLFLRVEKNNI